MAKVAVGRTLALREVANKTEGRLRRSLVRLRRTQGGPYGAHQFGSPKANTRGPRRGPPIWFAEGEH